MPGLVSRGIQKRFPFGPPESSVVRGLSPGLSPRRANSIGPVFITPAPACGRAIWLVQHLNQGTPKSCLGKQKSDTQTFATVRFASTVAGASPGPTEACTAPHVAIGVPLKHGSPTRITPSDHSDPRIDRGWEPLGPVSCAVLGFAARKTAL